MVLVDPTDALNFYLMVLFWKETHSKPNVIDYTDTSKAVNDVKKERTFKDGVRGSGLSIRDETLFEVWDR